MAKKSARNMQSAAHKYLRNAPVVPFVRMLYCELDRLSSADHFGSVFGGSLATDRPMARSQCPVFVMGCHRSGTNFLYDTLLSAGGFAIYRGYLPVYKILTP